MAKQQDAREQLLNELIDALVSEGRSAEELLGENGITGATNKHFPNNFNSSISISMAALSA